MLETTFEFMVYNFDLLYGIIFNFRFVNSNSGVVSVIESKRVFFFEVYDLRKFSS